MIEECRENKFYTKIQKIAVKQVENLTQNTLIISTKQVVVFIIHMMETDLQHQKVSWELR